MLTLSGCTSSILDPKGFIGIREKELLINSVLLMLIVVIPVILMTIYFSYKYHYTNSSKAKYEPDWAHSTKIEVLVWSIPIIIIVLLSVLTWRSTHELDQTKPIASAEKPMVIQVVSLDWKWLFIYPDQQIATVNYVVFPKNVPIQFKITSDDLMNSFFIPRLGSQMYAMPGMMSQVNLIANEARDYKGISASYSGAGFSDLKFTAHVTETRKDFLRWAENVRHKQGARVMKDFKGFRDLAKPTKNVAVAYYSRVPKHLFSDVVKQYQGALNSSTTKMNKKQHMDMKKH